MRFPKPWAIEQTGPHDCVVCDASGRKLFYIVGDEGDDGPDPDDHIEASVLFWGDEDESNALLDQIETLIEKAGFILPPDTEEQAWTDEVQKIVCKFVQDDVHLGELLLDRSPHFWEECREAGLTPQQALDRAIKRLSGQ